MLLAAIVTPGAAVARCQTGHASAPYIGAADMRAIVRASVRLPEASSARMHESVGASVPASVKRSGVPRAVAKALPQYRYPGYSALRVGHRLVIVNSRNTISYLLPLDRTETPGNCP